MDVSERLRPFVARLVVDWLRDTPGAQHRTVSGTLVFVDISGFTRLTERLAAKGKIGAEEMSDLLDLTFAALLSVAFDFGAWLVKWGGDAVLLLFEGDDHAARACTAAHEMRRTMRQVGRLRTSVGDITLRMSVGVHSGDFDFYLVGSLHHELVLTGTAASHVVAMETTAAAGEIVISPRTAGLLRARTVGKPKGPGVLLARSPGAASHVDSRGGDPAGVNLLSCLPETTADHLLAGGSEGEHRLVTVGFIEFSGIDKVLAKGGQAAVVSALDHLIRTCQEAAVRHQVTFWESDVGKDGGKVMLVSGAPRSAGEDEDRMLAVVRAVIDSGSELKLRAGVNSGRVYAGEFGPPFRRTYSVKGDAVNLAARLMSAAGDGEIYASHALMSRARMAYSNHPLPPLAVKGKKRPVAAHRVGHPIATDAVDSRVELAFAGREEELAMLLAAVARAREGAGEVWAISGDPGIGKSRLVTEMLSRADGMTIATVACDHYHSATPYATFRRLLRRLAAIADDADPSAAGAQLLDVVARAAPSLLPWAPLLAAVFDAEVPATSQSQALEPKFRKDRQEEEASNLLAALVPGPLVLVVEDAHLIDDASLDLLRHIAGRAGERPWLVVATTHGVADAVFGPDLAAHRLQLRALGADDVAAVIKLATEDRPLPPHEMALLSRRADGNPLFVQELLRATRDGGNLATLPDSIEGVLAVQIDRLRPQDRRVLRVTSVLGVGVDPRVLAELLTTEGIELDSARPVLAQFLDTEGEGLRFRHALARDAAYEGLPFSRRKVLHATAGRIIERLAGSHPETVAGLLSVHYLNGHEHAAAWRYARIAGDRAREIHAQVEAAEFYERALDAARRADEIDRDASADVAEALGETRYKLGEFERAALAYRQAKALASDDLAKARICYKLSLVADRSGRLRSALSWLRSARRLLAAQHSVEAVRLLSECSAQQGLIRHWQGKDVAAVAALHEAVALAEKAAADDALATALVWLDNCEMTLGMATSGEHAERALKIWRSVGNRPWEEARVLNQLGIRAYFEGRWDRAVDLYHRSKEACERAGDQFTAAVESGNMAEVLSDQGNFDEAATLLADAQQVWRAAAAPSFVAFGKSQLGRLAARRGRFDEAVPLLSSARADYAASGEQAEVLETDARLAECLALQGSTEQALATAGATLEATSYGGALLPQVPLLQRVRGVALAKLGDVEGAAEAFETSLAAARERRARHEVAWTLDAIASVRRASWLPAIDDGVEEERDALFAQLGIVRVATLVH